jgi:hypothetical protein
MRLQRNLVQDAWYEVRTVINNRKPLFRRRQAIAIFCRVFGEAGKRFAFEPRGVRLEAERVSFYIRPMDGLQLPAIMQWVKQTFAVRFNRRTGRSGYVWEDQYWSRVLEGEPPEGVTEVDWEAVDVAAETEVLSSGGRPPDGVSPPTAENPAETGFLPQTPTAPSTQSPPRNASGNRHRRDLPSRPKPRGNTDPITLHSAVRQRRRTRSAQSSTPAALQKQTPIPWLFRLKGEKRNYGLSFAGSHLQIILSNASSNENISTLNVSDNPRFKEVRQRAKDEAWQYRA